MLSALCACWFPFVLVLSAASRQGFFKSPYLAPSKARLPQNLCLLSKREAPTHITPQHPVQRASHSHLFAEMSLDLCSHSEPAVTWLHPCLVLPLNSVSPLHLFSSPLDFTITCGPTSSWLLASAPRLWFRSLHILPWFMAVLGGYPLPPVDGRASLTWPIP